MKRLVYIDTSEFVAANFDFHGERLKTLVARVVSAQIEVGMTSVTKNEILAKIEEAVHAAELAINKARVSARVLRNLDGDLPKSLFCDFDRAGYQEMLVANFEAFLQQAKVEMLDLSMANPTHVFDLYFAKKAPFAKEKKKAEFPDAFVLSVLSSWGEEEHRGVLIASSDGDIHEGVNSFRNVTHAGTLEQLLAQVAVEFDHFAAAAETALDSLTARIEQHLCARFQGLNYFLSDQDGDILEVLPTDVSYTANLLYVDDRGNNQGEATFDLVGTMHYDAALSYGDMTTATYDREERRFHGFDTIYESVQRFEVFQATLHVAFSLDRGQDAAFDVIWNSPMSVSVVSSVRDQDHKFSYRSVGSMMKDAF